MQQTIHRGINSVNALDAIIDWLSKQSTAPDGNSRTTLAGSLSLGARMTEQVRDCSVSVQTESNDKEA